MKAEDGGLVDEVHGFVDRQAKDEQTQAAGDLWQVSFALLPFQPQAWPVMWLLFAGCGALLLFVKSDFHSIFQRG